MMGYYGGFGWMGILAWLAMFLFWSGLIVLTVWAVRSFFPRDRRSDTDIAQDVLRRRYAAGEISEAEYQQATKTLS
ncbi:MAG TPA: SHOCT domain-containing protein [Ktedonobacterales bacterium]